MYCLLNNERGEVLFVNIIDLTKEELSDGFVNKLKLKVKTLVDFAQNHIEPTQSLAVTLTVCTYDHQPIKFNVKDNPNHLMISDAKKYLTKLYD